NRIALLLKQHEANARAADAQWQKKLAGAKTQDERDTIRAAKAKEVARRQTELARLQSDLAEGNKELVVIRKRLIDNVAKAARIARSLKPGGRARPRPKRPASAPTTRPKGPASAPAVAATEFMGDWRGTRGGRSGDLLIAAQVIALGGGLHRVNILREFDRPTAPAVVMTGKTEGARLVLSGSGGTAVIQNGKFVGRDGHGPRRFKMDKVTRISPTLGSKPPPGAIVLLGPNTTNLNAQWEPARSTGPCKWKLLPDGVVQCAPKSGTIIFKRAFGDHRIHIEFRTPFQPTKRGQDRGNSGVYVQGRFEIQVLDSYGLARSADGCGAIYKAAAPMVNMCRPPLQWQTYDIDFTAAQAAGRRIINPARITVLHNGVKIHDNVELTRLSAAAPVSRYGAKGPLALQEHGAPVEYRNIWVLEGAGKKVVPKPRIVPPPRRPGPERPPPPRRRVPAPK
ncbi:MAG: 3-keto-disaccharide hydrolase, partial [Planctomycetota bacterium]